MKFFHSSAFRLFNLLLIVIATAFAPASPFAAKIALADGGSQTPGYQWVFSLGVVDGSYVTKLQAVAGYVDDNGAIQEVYGSVQTLACTHYGDISVQGDHIVFEDGDYLSCQVDIASAINNAAAQAGFSQTAPASAAYYRLPALAHVQTNPAFAAGTDRIVFLSHPNLQTSVSGNGSGYYVAAQYTMNGNTISGTSAPFASTPDYGLAYSCIVNCSIKFSGAIGSSESGSWTRRPVQFALANTEFLLGCVPGGYTGSCHIEIFSIRVDPTSKFG